MFRFGLIEFVPNIDSKYTSTLTTKNSMFARPNGNGTRYYFKAIELTASISGRYMIVANSDADTYGCLYRTPFNPNSPLFNLLTTDDDDGPERNFNLTANLITDQSVIVVVTTYNPLRTISFNITVYGPAPVILRCKF